MAWEDLAKLTTPLGFLDETLKATGLGESLTKSSLNKEDIEAINAYMSSVSAKTPDAAAIRSRFRDWYSKLSTMGSYSDSAYQQAKEFRDSFNTANAITSREKKAVKSVQTTGVTRDEAYGLTPNTPGVIERVKSTLKWIGLGAGGLGIGYIGLKTGLFIARVFK